MFFVPSNRCWLANGFRRGVRHGTSSLARLDGETVDTIEGRAREGGRSQTGEAPPVVSAASFRSVSAPKGLPLRETVRPHSEITGNGLTPRPSDYASGYVAPHVALAALRPTLRRLVGESA